MSKLSATLLIFLQDLKDSLILSITVLYLYIKAFYRWCIPPPPKSLVGKVILITGSAGGIGRQICIRLARTGAILICWDVNKKSNDEFVKDLVNDFGVKAFSYQVDITNRSHVQSMIQQARKDAGGDINIVINNAGIMPCKPFLQWTPEELEKTFQVNTLAHFWILQETLPRMIELNDGHIVTMCSASGVVGTRNLAAYAGSKHAVHGFLESLKDEIRFDPRKPNIQFTTVYPYSCGTGLLSGVKSHSRFPSLIKTVLEPEEVAEQTVDAFRRNYEHVYIPGLVGFAGTTAKALLPEVQRLSADFLECYVEPIQLNANGADKLK